MKKINAKSKVYDKEFRDNYKKRFDAKRFETLKIKVLDSFKVASEHIDDTLSDIFFKVGFIWKNKSNYWGD